MLSAQDYTEFCALSVVAALYGSAMLLRARDALICC